MKSKTGTSFTRHKAVWIIGIIILILLAAFLFIGFCYTSCFSNRITFLSSHEFMPKTFYLYNKKIYAPVKVTWESRIATEEIPEYIGTPDAEVSEIRFRKPFVGYSLKGELVGQAEADFFYDMDEKMNPVNLFTVLSEDRQVIPGILWAEPEAGEDSLVVEITKPFSRKMLHVDRWKDYAVNAVLTLEAKFGSTWSRQFGLAPVNSKYFEKVDDGRWFRFQENLYLFYYDIFG